MMDCLCLYDGDGFPDVYLSQAHELFTLYIQLFTYHSYFSKSSFFKKRNKAKAHAFGDCA